MYGFILVSGSVVVVGLLVVPAAISCPQRDHIIVLASLFGSSMETTPLDGTSALYHVVVFYLTYVLGSS